MCSSDLNCVARRGSTAGKQALVNSATRLQIFTDLQHTAPVVGCHNVKHGSQKRPEPVDGELNAVAGLNAATGVAAASAICAERRHINRRACTADTKQRGSDTDAA